MKYLTLIFATLIFGVSLSYGQDEATFTQLIQGDNQSFYDLDFEKWQSYYVHESYTYFSLVGPKATLHWVGWEEIYKGFKKSFDSRQKNVEDTYTFEDFRLIVNGDMAWVTCTELVNGKPLFWQQRVFEKIDGQWKTLSLSLIRIPEEN